MRFKTLLVVFLFIVCLTLLTSIFSVLVNATEPANLGIVGTPSYYLYETKSDPTRYKYLINVTFYNSGDEPSVPVNIKLFEDGKAALWPDDCHEVSFGPKEYKNFTFDWSTSLAYKIVEIVYKPANANTLETRFNSGNVPIEIGSKQTNAEKTPGFEISMLVLFIFFIVLFLKHSKRRTK